MIRRILKLWKTVTLKNKLNYVVSEFLPYLNTSIFMVKLQHDLFVSLNLFISLRNTNNRSFNHKLCNTISSYYDEYVLCFVLLNVRKE